jgi:Uma2 family endonuclease
MSSLPKSSLTPEQYLEIERQAETRSEFFGGEMFSMAGATWAHTLITTNTVTSLHARLRSGTCRVLSHDMQVRVTAAGLYTYPDALVVCGPPRFLDDRQDTLLNPSILIEVLSPSTEAYDRGRKFEQYRTLESLQAYLLISSERVQAELYTRQPGTQWLLTPFGRLEDVIPLVAAESELPVAGLYDGSGLAA